MIGKVKLFSLSVVGMLAALMLSACGSGSNATQKVKDTSDNKYGYDDPIELKIAFSHSSDANSRPKNQSTTNNDWTRLYAKKGYKLKTLYDVDESQAGQKLSTAIASGNYPDIISTTGVDLQKYAKSGVISDISAAYKKYATPELKKYVEADNGTYLTGAKVDGKLYGIPIVPGTYKDAMLLWVRQDWLDKVNMTAPTTINELTKVADAFTNQDPDGDGKRDTYGLVINGKEDFGFWSGIQSWFECFGEAPGHWSGNFPFIKKNGKIQWGGADAAVMQKGLKQLHSMYSKGTLGKNFASVDQNALIKDVGAGKVGMYFAPSWGAMGVINSAYANDSKAHFVAVALPDGNGKGSARPYVNSTPSSYVTVSSKCKNPEALIKLANLSVQKLLYPKNKSDEKYDGDATNGIGWKGSLVQTRSKDNDIHLLKAIQATEAGKKVKMIASEKFVYGDIKTYLTAKQDGTLKAKMDKLDSRVTSGFADWTMYGTDGGMSVLYKDYYLPNKGNMQEYTTSPTKTMSTKYATLDPMTLQTIVKIVSGSQSVDSYTKFLKDWKNLGGAEVTKEAQKWYNANH